MANRIIVANWKMNPESAKRAVQLARMIERRIAGIRNVQTVIAPPSIFLFDVKRVLRKSSLGAQNVWWEDVGPRTGEISWRQARNAGVRYVIVGHSERKLVFGETNDIINKKLKGVLSAGITPILCVGEHERHGNELPAEVGEQLKQALRGIPKARARRIIVAYEPVWAISTMPGARPDTPANAHQAMIYIRKIFAGLYGAFVAKQVSIIYGGSVRAVNIGVFLQEGKMEGALVGGSSLDAHEFVGIVKEAARTQKHIR